VKLNAEEQEVMDHNVAAKTGIQEWGLDCNGSELAHAVHSLQMFVMIHAAHRENPNGWNDWYTNDEEEVEWLKKNLK
jgi:hypothetical protein